MTGSLRGIVLAAFVLLAWATAGTTAEPAQGLYAFIYRPGPAWRAGVPMEQQDLGRHAAYIAGLAAEGRVVGAGGFADSAAGGMAVVRARDLAAARDMLAEDPAIRSGVFAADVRPWRPRFGPLAENLPAG